MKKLYECSDQIIEKIQASILLQKPVKRSLVLLINRVVRNDGSFEDLIKQIRYYGALLPRDKEISINILKEFQPMQNNKTRYGFDPLKIIFDLFK